MPAHRSPDRQERERASARLKPKLKLLLKQPPDAKILNSIRRKEEQLKELADKPLSSLSGQEAFLLIRGTNLAYADAPDLFRLWWGSLDKGTQKQINIAAEDFADPSDYVWKSLQGPVLNATQATLGVKPLHAQLQQQLPKIDQAQFERLWVEGKQRSTKLSRGKHRSTVKIFIEDYIAKTRRLLYEAFSIAPNRPAVDQDRDRQFSKWDYQGWTDSKIAREWNRKRENQKHVITKAAVAKALERYRKRRAPIMWRLRVWISSTLASMPGC